MNLVIPQCNMTIELTEDKPSVLSIENADIFTAVLSDLWVQSNGREGQIILSDCEKILNIEKNIVMVFNPFMVSCNDKKIIAKLHKEIYENAIGVYFEEMQNLNGSIVNLLEKLLFEIPYGITYNLELDFLSLLKMYSVSVVEDADSFLEKMINYFIVMHRIGGISCFAILDFRQYFSEEDLRLFYEFIMREHLTLLILEKDYRGKMSNHERIWICDRDLCIINVN